MSRADRGEAPAGPSVLSPGVAHPHRAQRPRHPGPALGDALTLATALIIVTIGIWVRRGGWASVTGGVWAESWESIGALTGLLATSVALIGIAFAARTHRFERAIGLDRALLWHRWMGETAALLLVTHIVTTVIAFASLSSLRDAIVQLTGEKQYMAMATVGAFGMLLITVLSLGFIRRHLAYETWYFIHLLIYASLALAFAHEIYLGSDLAFDPLARAFWISVSVIVLLIVVVSRWGKVIRSIARPLTVLSVTPLNDVAAAIELGGRNVSDLRAAAGQFALLRPLTSKLVWQPHPYSISAAPRVDRIRFTVKALGGASDLMTRLPVGTKVAVEGPYGTKIYEALRGEKLLLIAGGVGIGPIRSLLEDFEPDSEPVVIYRARRAEEIVHYDELVSLAETRNGRIIPVIGRTIELKNGNPLDPDVMRRLVPDVAQRIGVVCGPQPMISAAFHCLRSCGVDEDDIHFERIWW
ncbi:MAG: ferric reductase-like transmembrane domain-containing protein [Actinomycetia bacterium]|nr:ferric reductase-like transmembrane domain-containing protein [Actinomycetes bacterium]